MRHCLNLCAVRRSRQRQRAHYLRIQVSPSILTRNGPTWRSIVAACLLNIRHKKRAGSRSEHEACTLGAARCMTAARCVDDSSLRVHVREVPLNDDGDVYIWSLSQTKRSIRSPEPCSRSSPPVKAYRYCLQTPVYLAAQNVQYWYSAVLSRRLNVAASAKQTVRQCGAGDGE